MGANIFRHVTPPMPMMYDHLVYSTACVHPRVGTHNMPNWRSNTHTILNVNVVALCDDNELGGLNRSPPHDRRLPRAQIGTNISRRMGGGGVYGCIWCGYAQTHGTTLMSPRRYTHDLQSEHVIVAVLVHRA